MHNRNDKNIDKVDKIYILWSPLTKSEGSVPMAQWTTQHCVEPSWATIICTGLQTIELLN